METGPQLRSVFGWKGYQFVMDPLELLLLEVKAVIISYDQPQLVASRVWSTKHKRCHGKTQPGPHELFVTHTDHCAAT
jgi:hypothetical protein